MEKEPILTVKDLSIAFHMYDKGLERYDLKVISNLDLDVYPGEIVAIAGSSRQKSSGTCSNGTSPGECSA